MALLIRDADGHEQLFAGQARGQASKSQVAAGWPASKQAEPTAEIFASQNAFWSHHKFLHRELVLA